MISADWNTPKHDDDPIIDPETGYAINRPFSEQGYPWWWLAEPEKARRIRELRKKEGIIVVDFPSGEPKVEFGGRGVSTRGKRES